MTKQRYAAFLRGITPMNAKMPDLVRAFEAAGFTGVRTLLSSGNVVFDARRSAPRTLAKKAEAAMEDTLGKSFLTFVRSIADLEALIASDPFAELGATAEQKHIVSFLLEPASAELAAELPKKLHGAQILGVRGAEVFSAYVPGDEGPVFMKLIEKTFGKEVTTRTWDTVKKAAKA